VYIIVVGEGVMWEDEIGRYPGEGSERSSAIMDDALGIHMSSCYFVYTERIVGGIC